MSKTIEWPHWLGSHLNEAVTDIHLVAGDVSRAQVRQNGQMMTVLADKQQICDFVNIVYWYCGFSIKRFGAYHHAQLYIGTQSVRVSCMDVMAGRRLCMRITRPAVYVDSLSSKEMLWSGCIVVAGLTGAGKTTEAYRRLDLLGRHYAVVTIEDPPEQLLIHCSQIDWQDEVVSKELLKIVLRHDPDVIYMGEVRDRAAADLLRNWISTGHACITTIHAGSPEDAWHRLCYLGFPPQSQHMIHKLIWMDSHQSYVYEWLQGSWVKG